MNLWSILIAVPLALFAPTLAWLIWRRVSARRSLTPRNAWSVGVGGLLGGLAAIYLERAMLDLTGLSIEVGARSPVGALFAMLLFIAPLEQGLAALSVIWLVRRRVVDGAHLGLLYAACAGAGFTAVTTFHYVAASSLDPLRSLRALLGAPAFVFFAGVWGFALGSGHGARRGRWFPIAWVAATTLHGFFALVVFGSPPGALVMILPLTLVMGGTAWVGLRDAGVLSSSQHSFLASIEPPSIEAVRRAFSRRNRPLMPHWIVLGALVTLGSMITLVLGAVFLGYQMGIDFSLAERGDFGATAPLSLLGVALLAAFPLAGFLVARATAATSVLEPTLGAVVAIGLTVAGLGLTAPITVVFALAAAPIALALACGGAWIGLS
ncbi:MAG: PrsW family intramembrane metalloprotease [Polyangiaceae bacterium]|nr:PrsW family intramembrane metalloprotease [Polyangiaceae bacterium]